MKVSEPEHRDWVIIGVIILIGFMCVFLVGGWAIRFSPRWELNADMGSKLDPNSDFLTSRAGAAVEPIDPIILTQPAWINMILTPGALIPTRIPNATATASLLVTPTPVARMTQTARITASPTRTLVSYLPTTTSVSNPPYTRTPIFTSPTLPVSTLTSVPPSQANLQITINDHATHYEAGIPVRYIIVASNAAGPASVTGAAVTGVFSAGLTNIAWTCSASAGASCTASGTGNINDGVNLPVGSSVTYTVDATVVSSPPDNLVGMASISAPSGITDPDLSDNSATDTDSLIVAMTPPVQIGPLPDGSVYQVMQGQHLTLQFDITVNGHAGWDMAYYELPYGSGVRLDWVVIQISDGMNWYTIFNWGDDLRDENTNMDFNFLPDPMMPPYIPPYEPDEREIPSAWLYPSPAGLQTGIAINLDGIIPDGTYRYIRFYAPPGDADGQMEIDAIAVLP